MSNPYPPRDRVLAFDFDGVIWDSVDEAGVMARAAWTATQGALELTDEDYRLLFRRARWQSKDGHDFFVTLEGLAQHPPCCVGDLDGAWFEQARHALRHDSVRWQAAEAFVEAFYASRERMREHDRERWLALQRAFEGVPALVEALRRQVKGLAIATTKDAGSARLLLESAGVTGVSIYGREVSLNKADHMRAIAQEFGVPLEAITFVDDLLENLVPLRALGVDLVLAGWGYNTPAEHQRARSLGVRVASLDSLYEQLLEQGCSLVQEE
jgi:phosphoglycolate phosphatase-like HAD superfamily hydrolase